MKKIVLAAVAAVFLMACDAGNLGFYLYPQPDATGIKEVRSTGPLAGLEVVGYLPSNKLSRVDPAQTRHLTDLVYFTLSAKVDGSLSTVVLTDAHKAFLHRVKRDYGVRVLMGVTDNSRSGPLSIVAADPNLRARFAQVLARYLVDEGFDGADFDWEYPAPSQLEGYASLLTQVRSQFASKGLRLSVAVSPTQPLTAAGYAAVDRVHGMLYDDWGRHSTLENSAEHVHEFLAQGVKPQQLLMGVPFYGRGYTAKGPGWEQAVSYKTLRERYDLDPSQDTVRGYYFNGPDTIRKKVEYAKAAGLSGVMVWEIGQDTNDDASLLAAITQARRDLDRLN